MVATNEMGFCRVAQSPIERAVTHFYGSQTGRAEHKLDSITGLDPVVVCGVILCFKRHQASFVSIRLVSSPL